MTSRTTQQQPWFFGSKIFSATDTLKSRKLFFSKVTTYSALPKNEFHAGLDVTIEYFRYEVALVCTKI
jgi:hypothetical protein